MPSRTTAQGLNNGISNINSVTGLQVARHHLQKFEECHQRGDIGQSFSHLSLALCILPQLKEEYYTTYLKVFEAWIAKVEEDNGFQEAMTIYEVALTHYPESPDLHHLLAKTLYRHGSVHEAWNHACLAHAECSRDPNAQETRSRLTNALVERWHLPMLNDSTRNAAFKSAIERAVEQGHQTILDIGSGTGLLRWLREIFMRNRFQHASKSPLKCFGLDKFLTPYRVSLVISETVDAGLFGEHILSTLDHAWKHLLLPPKSSIASNEPTIKTSTLPLQSLASHSLSTALQDTMSISQTSMNPKQSPVIEKDLERHIEGNKNVGIQLLNEQAHNAQREICPSLSGRVIPAKSEVYVALSSCDYISKQTKVLASDFSYFSNKIVCINLKEPYMSEKLNCVPGGFKLLSQWTHVTTVDFNSLDDITRHLSGNVDKTLSLQCTDDGSVDALILAFKLHLDEEQYISTFPENSTTFWENAVYPVTNLTSVVSHDIISVNFHCRGAIELSLIDRYPIAQENDHIYLSESAITFLNSKSFTDTFLRAAQHIIFHIKEQVRKDKSGGRHSVIVCDTAPFPVAGLAVKSELPDSQLYVEDEDIQKVLQKLGITVHLCEDLEDEVDILFIWPLTREGTLRDGLIKNIIMYRLMMAEDGFVFPQELDLIFNIISSPVLAAMTSVDDSNTCGINIADIFNIVKTNHHLDVPLSALPHTTVIPDPIPVLRLSLISGHTEALGPLCENTDGNNGSLLVLGGEVVNVLTTLVITQNSIINALPYWFHLRADLPTASSQPSTSAYTNSTPASSKCEKTIIMSSGDPDSPCNQSMFVLSKPMTVVQDDHVNLDVIWREGAFSATVQHHNQTNGD
ncbi:protein arginine N-methyltransferase 9-like [Panulirus ornatus]|uniref:protein arginine N-methyltransferase 9-like n=1 Tax=Panulirus ornatus TaxID=150431 RepID=UPI003A892DBA